MANAEVSVLAALFWSADQGRAERETLELNLVQRPQPQFPSRPRLAALPRLYLLQPPLRSQCHSDRVH